MATTSNRSTTLKGGRTSSVQYVYLFGNKKADGDGSMKPLLGGKGANLAEMTRIGLPVPPGFTITTEVCTYYYDNKRTYPKALQPQVEAGIRQMEKIMGTRFGDAKAMPLLVAVRSGARDSMPGMMDTILNLGLKIVSIIPRMESRAPDRDRKSTRLKSSHRQKSYAVFCFKKKKKNKTHHQNH